jgi:hypothetical protein
MRGKKWKFNGVDYKSRLEYDVALDLTERGVKFEYEPRQFSYTVSVTHAYCVHCGAKPAVLDRSYTPDFYLIDQDIYIETKGRFTSAERKKHAALHEQSGIDLRMLFASDNLLQKKGKKRYTQWCASKGIISAVGHAVPEEWIYDT